MLTLAVKPAVFIWPGVFRIFVLNIPVEGIPSKLEQESSLLLHGKADWVRRGRSSDGRALA